MTGYRMISGPEGVSIETVRGPVNFVRFFEIDWMLIGRVRSKIQNAEIENVFCDFISTTHVEKRNEHLLKLAPHLEFISGIFEQEMKERFGV